jgi:hypothetical protein
MAKWQAWKSIEKFDSFVQPVVLIVRSAARLAIQLQFDFSGIAHELRAVQSPNCVLFDLPENQGTCHKNNTGWLYLLARIALQVSVIPLGTVLQVEPTTAVCGGGADMFLVMPATVRKIRSLYKWIYCSIMLFVRQKSSVLIDGFFRGRASAKKQLDNMLWTKI